MVNYTLSEKRQTSLPDRSMIWCETVSLWPLMPLMLCKYSASSESSILYVCCHWFRSIVTLRNLLMIFLLLSILQSMPVVTDAGSDRSWCLPSFHRLRPSHFLGNLFMIFLFLSITPKEFPHIITSRDIFKLSTNNLYSMLTVWRSMYEYNIHAYLALLHKVGPLQASTTAYVWIQYSCVHSILGFIMYIRSGLW